MITGELIVVAHLKSKEYHNEFLELQPTMICIRYKVDCNLNEQIF